MTWTSYGEDPDNSYLELIKSRIRGLEIPHLYAGKCGWVTVHKIDALGRKENIDHITTCTPDAKKKYKELQQQ